MKPSILLLALSSVIALSNCTTAYKTGQTPDDVYFSPARPQDEYVRTEKKQESKYYGSDDYYDDRYLHMKVQNRSRWSELDDWYYYGNRYNYSYYNTNYWNNPWTPYTYWNCTHNPYYTGTVIVNPKSQTYNSPRSFNLNTYSGNNTGLTNSNYSNPKTAGGKGNTSTTTYTNTYRTNSSSSNGNTGGFLRNIFSGSSSSSSSSGNNNSSSSNSSSSSSSSSSSGSSSSGSGSSAPVRRF